MYKVGDKFIIEISGTIRGNRYAIKGFKNFAPSSGALDKLEKFDPDKYGDFANKLCEKAKEKGYEQGLNDAWGCAKKIYKMKFSDIGKIYGEENDSFSDVIFYFSPQEAIKKIKKWEESQEIEVWDVVQAGGEEVLVTHIDGDCFEGFFAEGERVAIKNIPLKNFRKTGKHIDLDKIFELLEEKENE